MCEWRIFWPKVSKEEINISSIIGAKSFRSEEPRTDIYVRCTEAVGIKFRNRHSTEVKQRRAKYDGMEVWRKDILGSRPSLELTSEAGRDYLIGVIDTLLKREREDAELKKARHTLATTPTINVFGLEKHRKYCSCDGCFIELTHIRLEGTDREYWSVSIEGGQSTVEKLLRKQVQHEGNRTVEQVLLGQLEGGVVQGYPEMVTRL